MSLRKGEDPCRAWLTQIRTAPLDGVVHLTREPLLEERLRAGGAIAEWIRPRRGPSATAPADCLPPLA